MNSAVIKYLFVQTLTLALRESYREAMNFRLRWRQRLTRYSLALKAAEFTLKDFVIETLMGQVEMDEFEEFREDPIGSIEKDIYPTSELRSTRSNSIRPRAISLFKTRIKMKLKRMLRKMLLPIIEKHEKRKMLRKKHAELTTNNGENRYRTEWSP